MHSLTTEQMTVLLVAGGVIIGIYLLWQARKAIVAAAAVAVVFAGWTMYSDQIDDFINRALQQAQPGIRQIEETLPQPAARQQPKEQVQVTITPQPPQTQTQNSQDPTPFAAIITGKVKRYANGGLQIPVCTRVDYAGQSPNAGGWRSMDGIIDSGAYKTAYPDQFLRELGYSPVRGPYQVTGVGGAETAYDYKIPYPYIWQGGWTAFTGGQYVQTGRGTVTVMGLVGYPDALIGADIISHNSFSITGDTWVLGVK